MKYYIIMISLLLISCGEPSKVVDSTYEIEKYKTQMIKIEATQKNFEKCMELASKIERKADDDVSNIVDECNTQSHQSTFHMKGY